MVKRLTLITAIVLLLLPGSRAIGQDSASQVSWDFTGTVAEEGSWAMHVTAPSRSFQPGSGLTLAIDFTINSIGLSYNVSRINGVYTLVTGSRVFNENGEMIGRTQALGSTILTGVGLPIESPVTGLPTDRFGGDFHNPLDSYTVTPASQINVDTETGVISGTVIHDIQLDPNVPTGWYELRIDLGLEIEQGDVVTLWGVNPNAPGTTDDEQTYAITDPVAIGTDSQPKLIWTLFSSSLQSGGVVALEDQGFVGVSRHLGFSTTTILPMTSASGRQITYSLEPDFVFISNNFMRTGGTVLNLDYHSGWMEARIENPDGTVIDLGGAEFNGRRGLGATTLQDKFAFCFSQYGRHRIELSGWVRDESNQTYVGGGVYEVYVAKPLKIEPNIINGMPFKKNEFYDPGFRVYPPVPANVDIAWQLDPYSSHNPETRTFTTTSNRWGYYSPPIAVGRDRLTRATEIQFITPGEYRVTYVARYREEDGTLWMGEKTITGLVLPEDPIDVISRPPASGSFSITSDARYIPVPGDTGNTVILPVDSNPLLPTIYTFPLGFLSGDQTGFRTDDSALLQLDHVTTGNFVTPRLASSSGLFPALYPFDIDRTAYIVASASRNDGRSQFYVGEGSSESHLPYPAYPWNSGEVSPDAAGDFYHIWGGIVYRDNASQSSKYGYYSTGIVLNDTISTPKLHEAGTQIISDGWGGRNLFLHNMAVEPGTIIDEGSVFTPASYFLPLPEDSTVEFTVTPPAGNQISVTITGDNRGYAADLTKRFELPMRGVWKVESRIIQADQEGSILGVSQGIPWVFYVIDGGNSFPIEFHMPPVSSLDLDNPEVIFIGDLTGGDIVQGKAYVSSVFNSAVIEQTERTITDGSFTYSIDLEQIPNSFPNFDPFNPDDRLVITFFVDGLTSNGSRQMAAKSVYISGGQVFTGEKEFRPIDPRSRDEMLEEMTDSAESDLARELRGRDTSGLEE